MNLATVLFPLVIVASALLLHFVGHFGWAAVATESMGGSAFVLQVVFWTTLAASVLFMNRFTRRLASDFIRQPPVLGPVIGFIMVPLMLGAQWQVWRQSRRAVRTREQRHQAAAALYHPIMESADALDPKVILSMSALELGAELRAGTFTSEQLTAFFLHRIAVENYRLNAVVYLRPEDALRDARARDRTLENLAARGLRPMSPFFGVPTVIKECMEYPGAPYSAGVYGRRFVVGKKHATAIHRLEDLAGFVVMGSTNTSEACMWFESYNGVYGRTCNPFDPRRTPGGSSGGIGAAIAAGFCPLAVGSDVGGSIRIPAMYCGLFGHKPSGGMVPNTRTQPHCTGLVQRFCQIGPLATHAADLLPLLHILAGPDGECGGAQQFPSKIWPSHPLDNHKSALSCGRNLNATDLTHEHDVVHDFPQLPQVGSDFLVLDVAELSGGSILASRIHPEQRAAHRRVVKSLRHAGCRVQTLNIPELAAGFDVWSAMMDKHNDLDFWEAVTEGHKDPLGEDSNANASEPAPSKMAALAQFLAGRSNFTLPGIGLAIIEDVIALFPGHRKKLLEQGEDLRAKLASLLGGSTANPSDPHTREEPNSPYVVMVYPSLPVPAPRHHENLGRIFDAGATNIFNSMELPVTQVPLGLSKAGLPLGVQIVGGHGHDLMTLAVAEFLEKEGIAYHARPSPQPGLFQHGFCEVAK